MCLCVFVCLGPLLMAWGELRIVLDTPSAFHLDAFTDTYECHKCVFPLVWANPFVAGAHIRART